MKKKIGFAIVTFVVIANSLLAPISFVNAQANNAVIDTSDSNNYEDRIQDCSFTNIGACGVNFVYYLILTPSAWFARITGEVFDYFAQYAIDSNSYKGNDNFIERGWSIIRDIGNVLFIFALLYIAISHILQFSTSGTKKFLINLIIAALLINFSLFFSRVIIDAGNILARAFYNNIVIPNDDNIQYHTISQGIVAHVNPQRILSSDLFLPKQSNAPTQTTDDKLGNGYAFTILAIASAVNITIGITFLSVCLLFVGRVVGLWFLMIFSPFAFASVAVPSSGKIFGQFSFSGWLDQIMKLSFMAPVFMFFLFLLIMFLQVIFQTNIPTTDQSTVQKLMAIIIPFAMVVFILNKAKTVAADLAGEAGTSVKNILGKAVGTTAGLAFGASVAGVATLGRATIGYGANKVAESRRVRNWASRSKVGRTFHKASIGLAKNNYDFRSSGAGKRTTTLLNQGFAAAGLGGLDAGKATTKGGYRQRLEEYIKEKEKFKEDLKTSDHEVQKLTYDYIDSNGNRVTRNIEKSLVQAETEFLRKQNDEKRKDVTGTIVDLTTGAPTSVVIADHEGWTKEKERVEKTLKQREADRAAVQRDPNSTQAELDDARDKVMFAKSRIDNINSVLKNIESNWKMEEKDFKAVKRAVAEQDTKALRNYSQSVKQDAMSFIYDMATGKPGAGRKYASEKIGLAAEKEEKKAQAEAKKEDKH